MPTLPQRLHLLERKTLFWSGVFFQRQNIFFISFLLYFFAPFVPARALDIKDAYERAIGAYQAGQYGQAMDLFTQISKAAPTFAAAYNGMALANQALSNDTDKSIEYLKTAISYDPKMAQAYDNLGRIYYGREDIDHAQEYFEKALKIDPNLASSEVSLAWIYLLVRSKPETALKYFKKVLAVNPDPKIYFGMGSAYFASNQRENALEMITKLHQLGEEDLASRLEASMRENPQVNAQPDPDADDDSSSKAGLGPLQPTEDKPTGMQARLRGKLSDY